MVGTFVGVLVGIGVIFVGALATAVLSTGDAFCAHGITRSIPIRSVLVEESLLKARISEALMLYFAEIPEMVSHLAILCTTHETGGILIIIPGLRVVRSPSFAHRIASILTYKVTIIFTFHNA